MAHRNKASQLLDIHMQRELIDNVMQSAANDSAALGIKPSEMRNADGSFTILPMLIARSNLSLAEATLHSSK